MSETVPPQAIPTCRISLDCEVLVVGYGPVGAAIANLLGRYGVNTVVVDKAQEIFMAPRAIALDNEALRILQLAGVKDGDFATLAIPEVFLHSPQAGRFGRVNMAGGIDGHPKLVTFYQPELERALREKAAALGSVQCFLGYELMALAHKPDCVVATLRGPDGGQHSVKAAYIVAADGASSRVRILSGLDFKGETYSEDWLIIDAKRPGRMIDHVEFICDPSRPVPHMPAPGGRERWEFMLKPGETREQIESDESVRGLLSPWGNPDEMDIERRAVYRFHARVAECFRKGRVFLAGDAAHVTPPFVGQGLVAGLRDAANLSWKLAWVVKGRSPEAILDSYDDERRPHACAMIRLARLMGRLVMPRTAAAAWTIHGCIRLLRLLPFTRRYFDELGIKPKNQFASGLFVKGRSGSKLVRGGLLPQGWVRDIAGNAMLSDEALGPGLTLIGFGANPATPLDLGALAALSAAGGRIVHFGACGTRMGASSDGSFFEDLDNSFIPSVVPHGWAAIVRPDRTIVHDGPIQEVPRILRESLQILGLNKAVPALKPSTLSMATV